MSRCTFALWWLSAGLAVGCHRETSKGLTAPNPSTDATPALVVSAPPPAETSAQGLDESEKACKLLAAKPLPSSDAPGAADLPSLAGCDAEALYYGIGRARDFVAARQCASAQMVAKEAPIFGGSAILMMIYANGRGVPRDIDAALALACDVGGAPAELEGRLAHLRTLKRGEVFDLCDDATSGFMGGACAAHEERFAAVRRDAKKRAATEGLPKEELERLDATAAAFFEARSSNEVDLSGTLRAAFVTEERAKLEDGYIATLAKLRKKTFSPPAGDFKEKDQELNRTYHRLMSATDAGDDALPMTTVTRAGIRATQRLWISYRDAFVVLATKVRPEVASDVWKAWLTDERTKMLINLEP